MLSSLVSHDHLNLLVSAGYAFDIVADSTTSAALRGGDVFFAARSFDELGQILLQQNLAAVRWLAELGRVALPDRRVISDAYRHVPVEPHQLNPLEVIKACQAYQDLCRVSPSWPSSRARQFATGLTVASIHRLPGYAEAPWRWTRPRDRSGPAIAYGAKWRPPVAGLDWVDLPTLIEQWDSARLVAVTLDVAAQLPPLPARPSTFVLTRQDIPDEVWPCVESLQPEGILFYPVCEPWLQDRLQESSNSAGAPTR